MLFGHNSNVRVGDDVVHVQTEDRGHHALIDTTVHWKGRVLHRRTDDYEDLLPLDAERQAQVKTRLDEQHRRVMEEIRSGALQLAIPKTEAVAIPAPARAAGKSVRDESKLLGVELTNVRTWFDGKRATLQVSIRDAKGNPVANARTHVRVEGAATAAEFHAESSQAGIALLQFEMPKLASSEAALMIEAQHNGARGHLRFQLRAKPKT